MPKKTKKEKIIAQYRKRLKLIKKMKEVSLTLDKDLQSKKLTEEEKPTQKLTPSFSPSLLVEDNYLNLKKYFLLDMQKSLILSTLIIGAEIALSVLKVIK